MSKKLKFIAVIIAIGILVPIAVTLFLNVSDSKKIITSLIEENTGHRAFIKGDLGMSFGLSPTVYAENISLSNSQWGQSPQMLEIDRLIHHIFYDGTIFRRNTGAGNQRS